MKFLYTSVFSRFLNWKLWISNYRCPRCPRLIFKMDLKHSSSLKKRTNNFGFGFVLEAQLSHFIFGICKKQIVKWIGACFLVPWINPWAGLLGFWSLEKPIFRHLKVQSVFQVSSICPSSRGNPLVLHRQLRSPILSCTLGPWALRDLRSGLGGPRPTWETGGTAHLARWGTCVATLTGPWGSASMRDLLVPGGWAPRRVRRTWGHSSLALPAPGDRKWRESVERDHGRAWLPWGGRKQKDTLRPRHSSRHSPRLWSLEAWRGLCGWGMVARYAKTNIQ